jgi:membrane fusion protein (multidrug efflux system)
MKRTLSLLAALLLAGCKKETPPAPPPPTVLVMTVSSKDAPIFHDSVATLDGSLNTDIRAQVSGYLIKQNYVEGSMVHQGDLLFEIDPRTYKAEVDKAKADLESAQAKQVKTQLTLNRDEILIKANAISQRSLDDATQENLAALADVAAAKAALESAQINLDFTRISTPIDGLAGKALPNLGSLITPSQKLTTVSTLDPIQASLQISEQAYLRFAPLIDAQAKLPLDQRPEQFEMILADGSIFPKKGRFYYVDREVSGSTGTLTVYSLFPNPGNLLRPGQYALVRSSVVSVKNAILVPQRAVNELQTLDQVAVIGPNNTAEIRTVMAGDRIGSDWIITSGLKAGDRVVVEGFEKCRPGMKVNPQPYKEAKPPAPTAPQSPAH